MPVPSSINDLSTTAGSNSPAGSEGPQEGDNYIRALSSFIAGLRDQLNGTSDTGTVKNATFSGTMAGAASWSSLQVFLSGLSSTTGTFSGAVTASNLIGSEYTPTLTNETNVSASTAFACRYIRVSNTIYVSGRLDIDPTSGSSTTIVGISLPVATTFSAATKCTGTAVMDSPIQNMAAVIFADTTNNRAKFSGLVGASDLSNRSWYFNFSYTLA